MGTISLIVARPTPYSAKHLLTIIKSLITSTMTSPIIRKSLENKSKRSPTK